jgi:hypothetical protein
MKKPSLYALAVVSLLLVAHAGAFACGCPTFGFETWEQDTLQRLQASKAVFAGTVVKVESEDRPFTTTIKVERWWKGDLPEEIVLVGDGGSCEFHFTPGKKYLVFAYEEDGRLKTGSCSRNVTLDKAGFRLRVLGKGNRPKKPER